MIRSLKTDSSVEKTIYISSKGQWLPDWRELWEARELLIFLVWREVIVRYKQTAVGAGWAIIQPFMTMVVFSIFFGNIVDIPSQDIPYPLFSYTGLVPWAFFSSALGITADSVIANSHIIRKVYVPRLIFPLALAVSRLVDFGASFVVLIGMLFAYGYIPSLLALVMIPLMILLMLALVLGIGAWLAVFNVYYRDVRQLVPFLIQLWLFATPVIYPSNLLSKQERILYSINPMVSVVETFRHVLIGVPGPSTSMLLISTVTVMFFLVTGMLFYQNRQDTFTDVV